MYSQPKITNHHKGDWKINRGLLPQEFKMKEQSKRNHNICLKC